MGVSTQARPAPASYLAAVFVDDHALLLDLFTAVLTTSEGRSMSCTRAAAEALFAGGALAASPGVEEMVAELSLDDAQVLMRRCREFSSSTFAEDNERVRRLRRREYGLGDAPRAGSLRAAIQQLAERGTTAKPSRARRSPAPSCGWL